MFMVMYYHVSTILPKEQYERRHFKPPPPSYIQLALDRGEGQYEIYNSQTRMKNYNGSRDCFKVMLTAIN